jgi:hypothetical protein
MMQLNGGIAVSILDAILYVGAAAGLISIFLEAHQSRRYRPSFVFTQEGTHADFDIRDGMHFHDFHFIGLIRNASLNANTIVRLYLVMWKDGDVTKPQRFGHSLKSITDVATGEPLPMPLRMEGRSAVRADIVIPIRLTDSNGQLTFDGEFAQASNPVHTVIPPRGTQRPEYELVFEDAAGNYFDRTGRLLSRALIDLYTTLPNYKGWRRNRRYLTIARWWLKWKWAYFLSWVGFYK